jgi:hypothetical protein
MPSVAVSSCADAMAPDHRRPGAVLPVGWRPDQLVKNICVPPWFAWLVADIAEHPVWDRCRRGDLAACPRRRHHRLVHRSA